MRALKHGMRGNDVKKWQVFLAGQGAFVSAADGIFGDETHNNTVAFQKKHELDPDGKVGNQTLGKAMQLGFEVVDFISDSASGFPAEANFEPLVSTQARQKVFGKFAFVHAPRPDEKETIRITDDWESKNIVQVTIPQLRGIKGAPADGIVRCHRLAAAQLAALWEAWERAGMLELVLTWDGSFVRRFIRCSTTNLSNHAFGSAFDINAAFNRFGAQPAFPGDQGSLFDLVPIAHQHGFYWGGTLRNAVMGCTSRLLSSCNVWPA